VLLVPLAMPMPPVPSYAGDSSLEVSITGSCVTGASVLTSLGGANVSSKGTGFDEEGTAGAGGGTGAGEYTGAGGGTGRLATELEDLGATLIPGLFSVPAKLADAPP